MIVKVGFPAFVRQGLLATMAIAFCMVACLAILITTQIWGLLGVQISQPLADVFTGIVAIPFVIAFVRKKFPDQIKE